MGYSGSKRVYSTKLTYFNKSQDLRFQKNLYLLLTIDL